MIVAHSFVSCVSVCHFHLRAVDVPSLIWLKKNSPPIVLPFCQLFGWIVRVLHRDRPTVTFVSVRKSRMVNLRSPTILRDEFVQQYGALVHALHVTPSSPQTLSSSCLTTDTPVARSRLETQFLELVIPLHRRRERRMRLHEVSGDGFVGT